jgi:hypothetical protein
VRVMAGKRKHIPVDVRYQVLHESGFKCGNPVCRMVLTLDIHHLVQVSDGGQNDPHNLLPLCPNCHSLHHGGHIPEQSLRAWKLTLLALNEAFDRRSVDVLLALGAAKRIFCSGDGVLNCAGLVSSRLICLEEATLPGQPPSGYFVSLSDRGRTFVDGWLAGKQEEAIPLLPDEASGA